MFSVSHIMAFLMSILLRTVVSFCYLTSANALMQYFMKKIPFFPTPKWLHSNLQRHHRGTDFNSCSSTGKKGTKMGRYQTGAEDLSLTYADLLNCISKRLQSYKNNHILLICGIQRRRPSREEIYGRQWDKLFSFTSMHSWQNSRRSSLSIDIYIKSTEYALNVTYIHTAKLRLLKKRINIFFSPLLSNRKWLRHKYINMDKNLCKTDMYSNLFFLSC